MKIRLQIGLLIVASFAFQKNLAQTCSSTAPTYQTITSACNSGVLTTASEWSGNNPPPYTLSGGAYTIPAGDVVEITSSNFQLDYNLIIDGTLLISGFIQMGATNKIIIGSTGLLTCCSDTYCGGSCATCGNSDKVKIGTNVVYCGAGGCGSISGSVTGPAIINSGGLPILLNSFTATSRNQNVELKWSTDSEINFSHFVLEKSSDGSSFHLLDEVAGSGNSNVRRNYNYTDMNPFIGNSYYRLTSVDFDGYTENFNNNIVRVTVNAGKNFYIAPNPVQGYNLKGGINFDGANCHVTIYDRLGSIIGRYPVSGSEFELQLPNLPAGIYFAQLQSGEFSKSVRFALGQ